VMEDCSTDKRLKQEALCRRQRTDEYVVPTCVRTAEVNIDIHDVFPPVAFGHICITEFDV